MRKFPVLIFLCMALTVFGQEDEETTIRSFEGSAGLGLMFNGSFNGDISGPAVTAALATNNFNAGVYAYGDFIYMEVMCGLFYGGESYGALNYLGAVLGIYGKYPFNISQKINLFPLLGFEFEAALFANFSGLYFINNYIDWKQFWFKAGAGFDYKINETIHLRFEALYGVRLKSGDGNVLDNGTEDGVRVILNENMGHGITLRMAVGL